MEFYHRINRYILERYPMLWNTHYLWMMIAGIILNIGFYFYGYAYTEYAALQSTSISHFIFESYAILYYSLIIMGLSIFFGFRFFSYSGFNSFYRISKVYLIKLCLLLMSIFFIHTIVLFSFDQGVKKKTAKLLRLEDYSSDFSTMRKASVFLLQDLEYYKITNRAYPKPFPLTELKEHYKTIEDAKNEKTNGIDLSKPFLDFNGNRYQFGILKESTRCNGRTIIDSFIDVSKVYGISEYSLFNYENAIRNGETYAYADNFGSQLSDGELKEVHNWILLNDEKSVTKALTDFKALLSEYSVKNNFVPSFVAKKSLAKVVNLEEDFVSLVVDYDRNHNNEYNVVKISNETKYLEYDHLSQLNENRINVVDHGWVDLFDITFMQLIMLFLLIAAVLIILRHMELKSLLMGAVFSAFILILGGLILSLLKWKFWHEKFEIYYIMIWCSIILLLYVVFLNNKNIDIKWAKWFLVPSVVAVSTFYILLLDLIAYLTRIPKFDPCNSTAYDTMDLTVTHYLIGLICIFIGIAWVIRKIKARPE